MNGESIERLICSDTTQGTNLHTPRFEEVAMGVQHLASAANTDSHGRSKHGGAHIRDTLPRV